MVSKIFYTIDEVSRITRLPPMLILHYIRIRKKTLVPEHYPDINPRQIKGEFLFTRKDINNILMFIDKRRDETWEKWQLRRIKEIMEKRELDKKKPSKKPELRIIKKEREPE